MNLIDMHCHLDEKFYDNVYELIEKSKKEMKFIVPAGIDKESNRHVLKLAEKYPGFIKPALGIYPPDALAVEDSSTKHFDIDKEVTFIEKNKDKIVAIGEVGMDFKHGKDKEMQESVFRKMIELAIKIDKPLIIHSRQAEKEVIDILEQYNYKKIIMHCFCGKYNLVKKIRENDWYFTIPTSVVRDEHFQRIVKETSLYRIFTETDSPYLSPFKGEKNEPLNVKESIKIIAKLRNMSENEVANVLYRSSKWLF